MTLFRVIYAMRDHKIRSFAQVFKQRKCNSAHKIGANAEMVTPEPPVAAYA